MKKTIVHVVPNAHLDPVWLWDFREGLNEGVATCRAMLNLLDAEPDLTFIRGEAAIYEHIRRTDPATYARIKKMIRTGRFDEDLHRLLDQGLSDEEAAWQLTDQLVAVIA